MKSFSINFLLLSLAAFSFCNASISSIELTRSDFESQIKGKNVLVAFYSPSCELSKRFFARFEKLAETINVRDDVKLAHVDCDNDKEFCESNNVQGLAVFFYPEGYKHQIE